MRWAVRVLVWLPIATIGGLPQGAVLTKRHPVGRQLLSDAARLVARGGERWTVPNLDRGSMLAAMTWTGASVAYGSLGLVAGALTPQSMESATRVLCAAITMLAFGWPVEFVVSVLGRAASQRAASDVNVRAGALATRLGSLSEALQALLMTSVSLIWFAIAWRYFGMRITPLAVAALPGAAATSAWFAASGRPPRAIHGWVPFVIMLGSTHAIFFDALRIAGPRNFAKLISTWSAVAAVVAVASLRCLAMQANAISLGLPASAKTLFFARVPGMYAIASVAVLSCLAWVAAALAWWAFHSIDLRLALGVVALVANIMEIAGARTAEVGAVIDQISCTQLGRLTVFAFERMSALAIAQATWRAFWFDRRLPGGNTRLQHQFPSISLTFASYGIAGALRGLFWRSFSSAVAARRQRHF